MQYNDQFNFKRRSIKVPNKFNLDSRFVQGSPPVYGFYVTSNK